MHIISLPINTHSNYLYPCSNSRCMIKPFRLQACYNKNMRSLIPIFQMPPLTVGVKTTMNKKKKKKRNQTRKQKTNIWHRKTKKSSQLCDNKTNTHFFRNSITVHTLNIKNGDRYGGFNAKVFLRKFCRLFPVAKANFYFSAYLYFKINNPVIE